MKRSTVKTIGLLAAMMILLLSVCIGMVVYRVPKYVRPDTSDWVTGDIFFSVGDSWKSVAVRSLSGAKNFALSEMTPSHSGIVVVDSGVVKLVHESTSAGRIVMETPDEYLAINGSYCIYTRRPRSIPDSARLVTVVDSLMKARVPFDYDFDQTDNDSLYCTEMVVRVYELSGSSEFSALRKLGYIYPSDLLKNVTAQ